MKKMKKFFALFTILSTLLMCLSFTGCSSTVDTAQTLTVKFKGVNGYGTATLEDEYDWIEDVNKGDNILELAENELKMRSAVEYSLDKKDHLSNGDEVTVTIKTKEVEGLNMSFKGGEVKFIVEGLKEAETFDPFENLNVTYEGYSPNGTLVITGGESSLIYSADKTSGLKNGDKITITVKPQVGSMETYIENYNKIYSIETKEYTVEGLAAYAAKLDDIPADMQSKMQSQALDSIKANAANFMEGNYLKSADFIGNYFLSLKDGASGSNINQVYCVYKCTASLTGKIDGNGSEVTVDRVYYIWYSYNNAVILPDGTCSVDLSKGTLYNGTFNTGITKGWTTLVLPGFKDIDSMLNDTVTKVIDKYTYESTVKDTEPSAPAEENSSDNSSDSSAENPNSSEASDSSAVS